MATSINSYSVGLGMDASGYIDGAKLSRSETKLLIKDIEAARSPSERFGREQDRLTAALDKGAISQATYDRLLEQKKTSLFGAASSANVYAAALSAVAIAGTAAIASGVAFVSHLRSVQGQIDDTVDSATKLGMTFNEVSSLRFAAQEGGGVEAETVDASIKKMMVNISKAIDGDEGIREAFDKLGLDAGELIKKGPVQSVMLIADAMQGVDSQAVKLALSMDIFGKSGTELVSTLDQGSATIQEAVDFQQKWNSLSEAQITAVATSNDAWDRIGIIVDGVSTKLAAEFAPAMLVVAETILGSAENFGSVNETVTSVVDTTVYLVGVLKDGFEVITLWNNTLYNIATMNFSGVAEGFKEAMDFSSGEKALQAVYDKRFELEQKAKSSEEERAKKREAMLASEWALNESKSEEAARKEAERAAEAEAKKEQSRLELAIKNANQFFEEEKRKDDARRKDIAKGPGSGMEDNIAKIMADQINAAIGAKAVPEVAKPSDEKLIAEAARQSALLDKADAQLAEQTTTLKMLLDEAKNNGFKRIR